MSTFLCHEIKVGLERQARQELLSWIFYCAPEWLRPLCFYEKLLRSRNSLVMIWNKVAILKWNNHPILRILLWQNYLWSHWNKPIFSIVFFISSSALQPDLMFDKKCFGSCLNKGQKIFVDPWFSRQWVFQKLVIHQKLLCH